MTTAASPRPAPRAILFDAFGTLFDVRGVDGLCERRFPDRGAALSELWRQKQLQYTWLVSLMGRYEPFSAITARGLDHAAAALGLELSAAHRRELLAAYDALPLFGEVRETLDALAALAPLGVLSNGTPAMLAAILEAAGIADRIAHVFSADAAKVFKPSPHVYAVATAALSAELGDDVGPGGCAFVSSNAWDVAGAVAFGFRTFYLNRSGRPQEALDLPAEATLTTLGDLVEHLHP